MGIAMARLGAFVTACVGAAACAATVHAADMPGSWPPPTPVMDEVSGWYLRGDIGYRGTTIRDAATAIGFPVPIDNHLDGSYWGGLGVGIKWGKLRTDLTADYGAEMDYSGANGAATASARIQTITSLANIYYDIGTWWGITPYIGAGAGFAYVRTSDYQSATIPPLSNAESFERYNFSWAVMAGESYQVTPSLSVDAGYRFIDQGDAKTATTASGDLTLHALQSHEFRIGLRWMYDNPSAYIR
jgi:opacity protein-like surface antigen